MHPLPSFPPEDILSDGLFPKSAENPQENSEASPCPDRPVSHHSPLWNGFSISADSFKGRRFGGMRTTQVPPAAESINPTASGNTTKRQPVSSAAALYCQLFFFPNHTADVLLCFMPGGHHFMTAAQAFQPEICAGSQNLPLLFTAGMGLFHHKDIIELNIDRLTPS